MSRTSTTFAFLALLATTGCERRSSGAELPAAQDWKAGAPPRQAPPGAVHGAAGDPHAGMAAGGGGDPHAGMAMGGAGGADPHAGMAMGGAGGADPHAGVAMGGRVGPGGLREPDPARPIDPSKFVRGRIEVAPELAGKLPTGGVVFLSARPAGPGGAPAGPPLAVDVLQRGAFPLEFSLTAANQMADGTRFEGQVVVVVRVDQDGSADSKQPGDVTGQALATIPADGVVVRLDTVLP